MIQSIRSAWSLPDLRRKLLFTLGMLILYRLLANIPAPGVNMLQLSKLAQTVTGNPLIDTLDLLSGGAVSNFSVMAMGVYPYITASIIIQLLTPIIPHLEELQSEGQSGRNQITRYTYYLSVPLAILQAVAQVNLIGLQYGSVQTVLPYWGFGSFMNVMATLMTLCAMTAGTMFAVWLGERITESGVGQGVSLIIFSGIVSGIPQSLLSLALGNVSPGVTMPVWLRWVTLFTFIILTLVMVWVIVYIQEGERRVRVEYGRRMRGQKVYQGQSSHVPLKVNTAGMIPIIFAQSLLAFPGVLAQIFVAEPGAENVRFYNNWAQSISDIFGSQQSWIYWLLYFLLVFGFTFFYTDVMIAQQKLHENLQKQGGFIPGLRPGKVTEQYIKGIIRRITLIGASFLAIIAVVPGIMLMIANLLNLTGLELSANILSGSGLIIVVGVVIDTIRQLESQLVMRNYEGML